MNELEANPEMTRKILTNIEQEKKDIKEGIDKIKELYVEIDKQAIEEENKDKILNKVSLKNVIIYLA